MKQSTLLVCLALACASASAASQPAQRACAVPDIPAYSTSNQEVRRVAREVKHFRACQDAAAPTGDVAELNRRGAAVESQLESWLSTTRGYSQAQSAGQRRLSFVDIDRVESGVAPRQRPVRRAPAIIKAEPAPAS